MMRISVAILRIAAAFAASCSRQTEKPMSQKQLRETQDALVEVNRMLVQKDKQKIINYIKEHNLTLKESPTGLWYGITRAGSGVGVKDGMTVTIDYDVTLLDGTLCYSSDSLGS